jgi:hypothetical protein
MPRATGPGPEGLGRAAGLVRVGLFGRAADDERLPEDAFRVDELPDVRLRVGTLERLAISREYP